MEGWFHRLYPFVLGAWLPLARAAENRTELIGWHELVWPVIFALLAVTLGWIVAGLFARSTPRRALIAALTGLWWSGFGTIQDSLADLALPAWGTATVALLTLPAVAYLVSRRAPEPGSRAGIFALLFSTILTGLSLSAMVRGGPYPQLVHVEHRPRPTPAAGAPAAAAPDVYLIVLDSYAGSQSLFAAHGYDNTPFTDSLRARGFFVPTAPQANYLRSYLALASMLNWEYVASLYPEVSSLAAGDQSALYPLIAHNRTAERFIRLGYRFAFIPSGSPFTLAHPWADWVPPLPDRPRGAFSAHWPETTPLRLWRRADCPRPGLPGCLSIHGVVETAARQDAKFESLSRIPDLPGPTFTFMHLLLPHEPYVYHTDCSHRRTPLLADVETDAGTPATKEAYVAQLVCLNRKVIAGVDDILSRSEPRPWIILQADHGQRYALSHYPRLHLAPADALVEWFDIFAAYLVPEEYIARLPETVSPVNAIRLLLGDSAGLPLAPLPDTRHWSVRSRPFQLVEVDRE